MHAVCARAVSVLRAFGADDVTSAPHAYGVDDIAGGIVCPGARPVFRVGHSKRAEVGHFSRAPRSKSHRKLARPQTKQPNTENLNASAHLARGCASPRRVR